MRAHSRCFHHSLVLLIFVAACGGGSDTVNPSPRGQDTTRVSNPVATMLVVQSGADQNADPGTVVAAAPVVVVKDASGAAMGGVTVQFTVSSGGGTVQQSSAVTATDGTATPGRWRLGPSEGRNELRVTSGTLTPVTIGANAVISSRTVADTSIAVGTITVTGDGPLKGASLTVPSAAFSSATRWTLSQQPTASWPKRANLNIEPVALRITGTASGIAQKSLTLTLPASPVAGQRTFVLMRDPASGGLVVLTTLDQTETTITVTTNHFDGTYLAPATATSAFLGRNGASSFTTASTGAAPRAIATGYDAAVVVGRIPVAELDKDYDTGFRPGVDDWEFKPIRTVLTSEPMDLGKTIGSLVYYGYLRGRGSLYKRYQLQPDVELSNRAGIRSSAYLQVLLPTDQMLGGLTAIRTSTRAGAADQIFYDVLKANLFVTGLPQMLVAEYRDEAYNTDDELHYHMKFLTVYRTSGSQVMFADPYRPGNASLSTQFINGRFSPLTIPVGEEGRTLTADNVDVVAPSTWLKMAELTNDLNMILDGGYPQVFDDARGDPLNFPNYRIKVRGLATIRDTLLYLPDTTRMWVECDACNDFLVNPNLTAGRMEPFTVYRGSTALGTSLNQGLLWEKRESRDERVGLAILQSRRGSTTKASWIDWTFLRAKQWSVAFTPAAPSGRVDTDIVFTATLTGPSSPTRRHIWDFGDQTDLVSTQAANSVTHRFRRAGTYTVFVTVFDGETNDLLVRDSVIATVGTPSWAGWRIGSLSLSVSDPHRNQLIAPGQSTATPWSVFKAQAASGSIEDKFIKQVALDSTELFGIANATMPGAVIYLDKDTVTRNPGNSRLYNSTRGLYFVVGTDIPSAAQTMAYSLDPFARQLASNSTWGGITYRSCSPSWDWSFTSTGSPLTGVATLGGAAWSDIKSSFPNGEPRRRPSITATVDTNGDLIGTIVLNYRLSVDCPLTAAEQVQWTVTGTFRGTRIK